MSIIFGEKGFSQDVYDIGKYFEVNLSFLIKEVIVAPYADNWFLELVKSVATRYDLKAPANKSGLTEEPVWDALYDT